MLRRRAGSLVERLALGGRQMAGSSGSGSEHSLSDVGSSTNIQWHEGRVSRGERESLLSQRGAVLWFTGLSGSGKSTVAHTLEHALNKRSHLAYVLDGDNVRHGLNSNLGFDRSDRQENVRRVGEVSSLDGRGMLASRSLCASLFPAACACQLFSWVLWTAFL